MDNNLDLAIVHRIMPTQAEVSDLAMHSAATACMLVAALRAYEPGLVRIIEQMVETPAQLNFQMEWYKIFCAMTSHHVEELMRATHACGHSYVARQVTLVARPYADAARGKSDRQQHIMRTACTKKCTQYLGIAALAANHIWSSSPRTSVSKDLARRVFDELLLF